MKRITKAIAAAALAIGVGLGPSALSAQAATPYAWSGTCYALGSFGRTSLPNSPHAHAAMYRTGTPGQYKIVVYWTAKWKDGPETYYSERLWYTAHGVRNYFGSGSSHPASEYMYKSEGTSIPVTAQWRRSIPYHKDYHPTCTFHVHPPA